MDMMKHEPSLRTQIFKVNLIVVGLTIALALCGALMVTLQGESELQDSNLMNSAQVISKSPVVIEDLMDGEPSEELFDFLDNATAGISDIDVIAVANLDNIQFYYTEKALIGELYEGTDQQRIFDGEEAFNSDDTGISGAERCAYAPVLSEDGKLLGFVMVGIYMRNVTQSTMVTMGSFIAIAFIAVALGAVLSYNLSARIKRSLQGYEPQDLSHLFNLREDVLEALDEGIVAIDDRGCIMYVNEAAVGFSTRDKKDVIGMDMDDVFPGSTLKKVLKTKVAENNVPLAIHGEEQVISDRMPIWEDGCVVGAVAIWRNRTEVTKLAKDLTGVQHMVDAMRAYTHEFMNKLHVILGLLHLGDYEKAEAYIMDVTSIQRKAVGAIMGSVENQSVAALLVGKTSRCAEVGIRLILAEGSRLGGDEKILPTDACVAILGNLIENAVDALNHSAAGLKEIIVSIKEEENYLLLCVEDSGAGMDPALAKNIFKKGFSTKSKDRGTGLALVHSVIKTYGGQVRVESELGVGTSFVLIFDKREERA